MKIIRYFVLTGLISILLFKIILTNDFDSRPESEQNHSCSTFLLSNGNSLLIAHNLDDYIKVPGLVVVNKRGVQKENISWNDLKSITGKSSSSPRQQWTSKYGSITYNTFGKEFIDGGMNETGFYVGEMTLIGTEYPKNDALPKIYHHQWMQYLLDNYSTVQEALESLPKLLIDGHCQWHFFIADRTAKAAVIEFLKGKTVIYKDKNLPFKVLCNKSYSRELDSLNLFIGFGGTRPVNFKDTIFDRRFVWANDMLSNPHQKKPDSDVDYAFEILNQMDLGNNKWSIVYDMKELRMYFNTSTARQTRYVDFKSFDFSCKKPVVVLDINQSLKDDVSNKFITYSDSINYKFIKANWNEIDLGFFTNKFFKPMLIDRLSKYPRTFSCTSQ
jgi:penicillin V acylase-like amidase (Ntn superfamily)